MEIKYRKEVGILRRKGELINLIEEIEEVKYRLYDLINKNEYNLSAPEVIELSRYLDELIRDYYKFKLKNIDI
ncbi:Spo0E like sporulation regulatory protein [Sporanaerobacter acetigenes DSM 13106]|uniref:Spo0E like sporulation regulatory protein n=1 Tax=Sporanaerobacter acetigenes DSM 13106 TaxID=1123281 RepID=A0A1M5VDH3_9FIRM|nr:Spo0E like sporulation regulatory protein [Sporanaerobacter acetigenes DSM 13106]